MKKSKELLYATMVVSMTRASDHRKITQNTIKAAMMSIIMGTKSKIIDYRVRELGGSEFEFDS